MPSFQIVSEALSLCRDVFGCLRFQAKDILLNKDLVCDLLCKTSVGPWLIVSNFCVVGYRVPSGWHFL